MAAAERRQQVFVRVFNIAIVEVGIKERIGEKPQRVAAGVGDCDLPRGARAEHPSPEQLRQQPAANERRLAASGAADDRHKAVRSQAAQELDRLLFTTEEEIVFFLREGPQSGKGVHSGGCGAHTHTSFTCPMKACSSGEGSNSRACRMTAAWCD